MEFAVLDKMIEELENEKNDYVKSMDSRIQQIRNAVEKMKEEYRNETIPEATGMVEYMIAKGKERLGKKLVEACDIPKDILEDFYEATDRKVDTKRVVMSSELDGGSCGRFYFFFTDRMVYLWRTDLIEEGCSVYPYKEIRSIKYIKSSGGILLQTRKEVEVKLDKAVQEKEVLNLRRAFEYADGTNLMRLLLDLRDYADREQ